MRVPLAVGIALVVVASCTENRRSLGEGCLKDEDCLSGICSGQECAAEPPMLDAEAPFQDAGAGDTSSDASGGDGGG